MDTENETGNDDLQIVDWMLFEMIVRMGLQNYIHLQSKPAEG